MPKLTIISPSYDDECDLCGTTGRVVIIRKVGDIRDKHKLCGRCLALAMQELTKQNWVSQYVLWQANSLLGQKIREEKQRAKKQ